MDEVEPSREITWRLTIALSGLALTDVDQAGQSLYGNLLCAEPPAYVPSSHSFVSGHHGEIPQTDLKHAEKNQNQKTRTNKQTSKNPIIPNNKNTYKQQNQEIETEIKPERKAKL